MTCANTVGRQNNVEITHHFVRARASCHTKLSTVFHCNVLGSKLNNMLCSCVGTHKYALQSMKNHRQFNSLHSTMSWNRAETGWLDLAKALSAVHSYVPDAAASTSVIISSWPKLCTIAVAGSWPAPSTLLQLTRGCGLQQHDNKKSWSRARFQENSR